MSVSTLDVSASASTTSNRAPADAKPQAKPAGPAPKAPAFNDHGAASVSFHSNEHKSGPVFGNAQPAMERHFLGQHSAFMPFSLLDRFRELMASWFAGHRPPMHPGCSNPPPRPNPGNSSPPPRPTPTVGRPFPTQPGGFDPKYSLMSREELAQLTLDNFRAFEDPKHPGYISVDSIHAKANKKLLPERGPNKEENKKENQRILLARELLRRPELINAMDRHSTTGALDGLIDRQKLNMVIKGDNYFKYHSDKQVVEELLEHFKELSGRGGDLKIADLLRWARRPLTGDAAKDHLTQLAQEFLKRSSLVTKLDNLASKDNDGRISFRALQLASR